MVVSPVVVVVTSASLYSPLPSVSGLRGSRVWILTLVMLMVDTFISPPSRSNFAMKKVLLLPDVVAFGPISTARTVTTKILVFLLYLYCIDHSYSEVISTTLASILVPMVQRVSGGVITSIFFEFLSRVFLFPLCAFSSKAGTHTNFNCTNICPMRFEIILIQNNPI